jgi:hypothetical protein
MDLIISFACGSSFTPFNSFGAKVEAPGWKHDREFILHGNFYNDILDLWQSKL